MNVFGVANIQITIETVEAVEKEPPPTEWDKKATPIEGWSI